MDPSKGSVRTSVLWLEIVSFISLSVMFLSVRLFCSPFDVIIYYTVFI